MPNSDNLLRRAELPHVTAFAHQIKDSTDILIEFYIGKQFYRKEIIKPDSFWYTWIKQEIDHKEKLQSLRTS